MAINEIPVVDRLPYDDETTFNEYVSLVAPGYLTYSWLVEVFTDITFIAIVERVDLVGIR